MSADLSFDEMRSIKVLVVPIGSNSLFSQQFQFLTKHTEIPLYEAKPNNWNENSSVFKYMKWNIGYFLYKFQRYDQLMTSDIKDSLNPFKNFSIIIGLINYPEIKNTSIDSQLNLYVDKYPDIMVKRVFVFNYSFDEVNVCISPSSPYITSGVWEIFPPENKNEEGHSMVEIHLREVIGSIGKEFFNSIEKVMQLYYNDINNKNSSPSFPFLTTTFDENNPVDKSIIKKMNIPKRQIARLKKWMGDYCLQVCCLGDAMELYLSAINDLRSIVDHIWLSGALEGLAASILIVLKIGEPIEEYLGKEISVSAQVSAVSVEIAAFRLAEEKLNESISIISKFDVSGYGYFASQSCLRLAKTLSQVNEENYFKAFENKRSSLLSPNDNDNNANANANTNADADANLDALGNQSPEDTPGARGASPIQISGEENKNFINNLLDIHERKSKAVDLINRAVGMQNLSKKQTIESYINGGEVFKSLHLFRKYILFFYKAANLFSEIEDIPSSVSILITLANFMIKNYHHAVSKEEEGVQRRGGNTTTTTATTTTATATGGASPRPRLSSHCWTILMRNTLTLLTEQAVKTGDLRTASNAVAELIQILGESIEIYDRLCMNTKRGGINSISPQNNTNFALGSDASSINIDLSEDIPESRSTITTTPSSSDKIYPDWGIYVSRSEQEKAWKYFLVNKILLAKSIGKVYPSLLISLRPSQRTPEAFISRENIQSAEQLKDQLSKGNTSVLFYDPFAARAALQREKDTVLDMYWTEGAVCKCVVMLQNIYEVSLLLEDMVVDWDLSCLHERDRIQVVPIPVTVCLPPKSPIIKLELKTYISVLSDGSYIGESNLNHLNNIIKIKGLEFSIHSSRVQIVVNDKGFPVHKFKYLTQYDPSSPEHKIKSLHSTICSDFSKTILDDGKEVLLPKLDSVQNTESLRVLSQKNIEKYQEYGEPNMKIFIVPETPASIEIIDPVNKERISRSSKDPVTIELFEGEFKFVNIILKGKNSSEINNGNCRISMNINGHKIILQDLNEELIGNPPQPIKSNATNDRINFYFSRDNIDSPEFISFQLLICSQPNPIDNKIENEHLNFKLEVDVFIPKLYEADGSDNKQFKIFYKYSFNINLIHRGQLLSRSSQYLSTKSLIFSKNMENILVSLLSKQNDKKTYENLTVNSIEHLHLNVFKNNLSSPVILFKDHNSFDAQNPINYSSIIKFLENHSISPSNKDNLNSQVNQKDVNMLCRFGPLMTVTLPDFNNPSSNEEGGCLYWVLKENSSSIHIGKFSDLNLSSSNINLNKNSIFMFNIDITSPLGNGKMYMRNEYELHLKGVTPPKHFRNHKLNYLEISFIIIEEDYWNCNDFDHNFSIESFSPYGSKDVFITGQPRKIFSPKYFKSQKENIASNNDDNKSNITIDLHYKLSLYFTKAGRYNILLLYNESFDLISEQQSIDYSRNKCNNRWWILRKPIEII